MGHANGDLFNHGFALVVASAATRTDTEQTSSGKWNHRPIAPEIGGLASISLPCSRHERTSGQAACFTIFQNRSDRQAAVV